MLSFLHHFAVLLSVKERFRFAQQLSARLVFLLAVSQKPDKLVQLHNRLIISDLNVIKRHIYYKNYFLPYMVKSNNLVKKHQINVLKCLCILCFAFNSRFAVPKVIV